MFHSLLLTIALNSPIQAGLRKAEDSTVIVNATITKFSSDAGVSNYQNKQVCSGYVAYSRGTTSIVVTARHCAETEIDGDDRVEVAPTSVTFFDGDVGRVTKTRASQTDDIMVLYVRSMRSHPYVFGESAVIRAEQLFAFGQPHGFSWSYSIATLMQGPNYAGVEEVPRTWLVSCPSCGPGSSGGPIYNLAGRVIGIVDAGDGQYTLIVPAALITAFLKTL